MRTISLGAAECFSLERPIEYKGNLHVNIADLARLKPLLIATGINNEIAGSLLIDWEGSGEATNFKNSGSLKYVPLEKPARLIA